MRQRLQLTLSGEASDAKRLRNDVRAWLLDAGINGTTGNDIVLAANEAFINAVEHPTDKTQDTIEVSGEIGTHDVVLRIRDHGQWQHHTDPARGHYGHDLIRRIMTETTIQPLATGTVVTLRRTLP